MISIIVVIVLKEILVLNINVSPSVFEFSMWVQVSPPKAAVKTIKR